VPWSPPDEPLTNACVNTDKDARSGSQKWSGLDGENVDHELPNNYYSNPVECWKAEYAGAVYDTGQVDNVVNELRPPDEENVGLTSRPTPVIPGSSRLGNRRHRIPKSTGSVTRFLLIGQLLGAIVVENRNVFPASLEADFHQPEELSPHWVNSVLEATSRLFVYDYEESRGPLKELFLENILLVLSRGDIVEPRNGGTFVNKSRLADKL